MTLTFKLMEMRRDGMFERIGKRENAAIRERLSAPGWGPAVVKGEKS